MTHSRVSIRMRPGALAPASARRWVFQLGMSWGLPQQQVEDAALVAGALVLHSVRQAGSPMRLALVWTEAGMLVEVEDACTAFPVVPLPPATGGRGPDGLGLDLVRRVAQAFGFTCLPGGRQIWARVAAATDNAAVVNAAVVKAARDRQSTGRSDRPPRHLTTAGC